MCVEIYHTDSVVPKDVLRTKTPRVGSEVVLNMSDKTIFILWGWYAGADADGQKILGVFETEEQANICRDSASPNILVFLLYEGYLNKSWEASLPGEIPRKVYFKRKGASDDILLDTDMEEVRQYLKHSYY